MEAFWGRKTVPKQVFEGSIMVLEKDANLKGVRDIPRNAGKRRETTSNGCPGPKGILSRETLRGFPWEKSLQGEIPRLSHGGIAEEAFMKEADLRRKYMF